MTALVGNEGRSDLGGKFRLAAKAALKRKWTAVAPEDSEYAAALSTRKTSGSRGEEMEAGFGLEVEWPKLSLFSDPRYGSDSLEKDYVSTCC